MKRFYRRSLMFGLVASLAAVVLLAGQAGGQTGSLEKTPWTVEDIVMAESAGQFELSPDAKRAVWVKSRMDKEKDRSISNLFLSFLETKKEIQLTRGSASHNAPRWSPNGETIAFLSTRPLPKPQRVAKWSPRLSSAS